MKDYRQIIADDNIHMKNLYKTIESQQQEIDIIKTFLRLASNTLGEIMALETFKHDEDKQLEYVQRKPYVWEATVNTYREVNKALEGTQKDPNERICPHCNSIGYSANEEAKCHKYGLRPKEDKK